MNDYRCGYRGNIYRFCLQARRHVGRLQSAFYPSNPAEAVLNGLNDLAHGKKKQIIHGSTVATNAILERNGAKTALITNKGFEDIIEIGRQNRTACMIFPFARSLTSFHQI